MADTIDYNRELDKRWLMFDLVIADETEDLITYAFFYDGCNEEEAGLFDVDKDIIHDIFNDDCSSILDMIEKKRIEFLSPYNGDIDFVIDDYDLSYIMPIRELTRYIINYNEFPKRISYMNSYVLDELKHSSPDIYENIMDILNNTHHHFN